MNDERRFSSWLCPLINQSCYYVRLYWIYERSYSYTLLFSLSNIYLSIFLLVNFIIWEVRIPNLRLSSPNVGPLFVGVIGQWADSLRRLFEEMRLREGPSPTDLSSTMILDKLYQHICRYELNAPRSRGQSTLSCFECDLQWSSAKYIFFIVIESNCHAQVCSQISWHPPKPRINSDKEKIRNRMAHFQKPSPSTSKNIPWFR